MVEVTEADRCLVADILESAGSDVDHAGLIATADLIRAGRYDDYPTVQIAATHREAAAKAERDRLRERLLALPPSIYDGHTRFFTKEQIAKALAGDTNHG